MEDPDAFEREGGWTILAKQQTHRRTDHGGNTEDDSEDGDGDDEDIDVEDEAEDSDDERDWVLEVCNNHQYDSPLCCFKPLPNM